MFPVHDVDAFLLLAIAASAKRRPADLVGIIAAGDLIQGATCSEQDLSESFHSLSVNGLIIGLEGGYTLTSDAEKILSGQPKKADAHERIQSIKGNLSAYNPKGEHSPVQVSTEQLSAAILMHQTSKSEPGRNLFVPKPRPAELDTRRRPIAHRRKY
ncbi:MAG: hypothetical protein PHP85_08165 [Gallionella sp.]|nr:hypothetical protein [Gallionella sp.]